MLAPFTSVLCPASVGHFFDFDFVICYNILMKTFTYVEDYLEVINGDRDPNTGKIYGLFDSTQPIVSLARYDVQVLASMSAATQSGRALTDRQAELAVKIIQKYQKQLEKLEISIDPIRTPQYRHGIRTIDRRKLLYVENDHIVLKFPYDTKLIDDLRDLAKISQGTWAFDSNARAWRLAITEVNVVAANGFAANHEFEIGEEFLSLLQEVVRCEQTPYAIKLIKTEAGLEIQNASSSLIDAIRNYCGFDSSNVDTLVDNSAIYGYTVDQSILDDTATRHNARICNLMTAQESKFRPDSDDSIYTDLIDYAQVTGRFPIYVYEPDLSGRLYKNFVSRYFDPDDIYQAKDLKKEIPTVHKKVIYFNKYMTAWDQPIPLLVSGQGMMHGGEKTLLLQRAEKVVYFATEVYNNKKTKPS